MTPLDLVKLPELMKVTSGRSEIAVGMVDGPIAISHADLARSSVREVAGDARAQCAQTDSAACVHGTFVAGILSAKRGSTAPAICPDCTLLVNPVFSEAAAGSAEHPSSTQEELAAAILKCIEAGVRVVNLSLAVTRPSSKGERVEACARSHRATRRYYRGGGGQSGQGRWHGHHQSCVGICGGRVRCKPESYCTT
jgi:subtilisin family serine protease